MKDTDRVRLMLMLSPEARRTLRIMAAERDTTASALVESLILAAKDERETA